MTSSAKLAMRSWQQSSRLITTTWLRLVRPPAPAPENDLGLQLLNGVSQIISCLPWPAARQRALTWVFYRQCGFGVSLAGAAERRIIVIVAVGSRIHAIKVGAERQLQLAGSQPGAVERI